LTKNNGLTLDTIRKEIINLDMFLNFYSLNRTMSEEAEGTYVSSLYKENRANMQTPRKLKYLAAKKIPENELIDLSKIREGVSPANWAGSIYGGKRKSTRRKRKSTRKKRKSIRKKRKSNRRKH
jgi:hypothetical protein